jgi:CCCH-type zinc finger
VQIGGKLIETNENLLSSPSLLWTQHQGTGYVAVLYPETELPNLATVEIGLTTTEAASANSKICFAWAKGSCARGDKCKFEHFRGNTPTERRDATDGNTDVGPLGLVTETMGEERDSIEEPVVDQREGEDEDTF